MAAFSTSSLRASNGAGRWHGTSNWMQSFRHLTLDQVNAAFRRYIVPAQISIVKGGDFKRANAYP